MLRHRPQMFRHSNLNFLNSNVPILKWHVPMLVSLLYFPMNLEPTFKLYVACSLKFVKIMMLIQSANNMQGNVFTHL